jgi:hypothetical protein
VLNWLWLALAQQRLGRAEEARRSLGKATAWLDQYADRMPAAPMKSWDCTCTIGWKRTSCAARQRRWFGRQIRAMFRENGTIIPGEAEADR